MVCLSCCDVGDTVNKYSEMVSQYYFESCHSAGFFLFLKAILHQKASQHCLPHASQILSWESPGLQKH